MSKRRFLWTGLAVCLLVAAGFSAWRVFTPHPINRDNFERIKKGMTRSEVESILGCTPGDYATVAYLSEMGSLNYLWGSHEWISNDGRIRIWFDKNDCVAKSSFSELAVMKPRLVDRLRRLIGM